MQLFIFEILRDSHYWLTSYFNALNHVLFESHMRKLEGVQVLFIDDQKPSQTSPIKVVHISLFITCSRFKGVGYKLDVGFSIFYLNTCEM